MGVGETLLLYLCLQKVLYPCDDPQRYVQGDKGVQHGKMINASNIDPSLTNPNIFFVLGVFPWSLPRIIMCMIFERVDNREMEQWPFPPGLEIGITIAVFHCSGSFPSIQDWLNMFRILFLKECGALV